MQNKRVFDHHDFYCIKCGNKGIPLSRPRSADRGKFHLKYMYCIYCKMDMNHVECRNAEEVAQFKEDFAAGKYQEEVIKGEEYSDVHPRLSTLV